MFIFQFGTFFSTIFFNKKDQEKLVIGIQYVKYLYKNPLIINKFPFKLVVKRRF